MSKLLEQEAFKKYLEKFGNGKLNLTKPSHQAFLKQFAGAILMLVPEAAAFLVDQGMKDDIEIPYLVMAAFGSTLKEVGETNLEEIRKAKGDSNEETSNVFKLTGTDGKLWN